MVYFTSSSVLIHYRLFYIFKKNKTKDLHSVYIMKTGKTNEKYYNSEIPNSNSKLQ